MFQRSFFYEVGVCLTDSGTEHVPSSIQKLHIVQIGRTVSKLLGFLISKFGFAGNFFFQPRNAMILADGLMQCNIALQCNSGCSAVQGKAMPEKKERKK